MRDMIRIKRPLHRAYLAKTSLLYLNKKGKMFTQPHFKHRPAFEDRVSGRIHKNYMDDIFAHIFNPYLQTIVVFHQGLSQRSQVYDQENVF